MSAAQPDRAAAGRRVDARSRFDDATHARKRRTHYPTPVVVTMVAGLRACASTLTRAWTWQTSLPRPRTATSTRRAKNAVQGERGTRGRGPGSAHAARLIRARFSTTRAPGLVRWGALHLLHPGYIPKLHPHCHCHAAISMLLYRRCVGGSASGRRPKYRGYRRHPSCRSLCRTCHTPHALAGGPGGGDSVAKRETAQETAVATATAF